MKHIIKKSFKPKVRSVFPLPSGKFRTSFYFTSKELELPEDTLPIHYPVVGTGIPNKETLKTLRHSTLMDILIQRAKFTSNDFITTAEDPVQQETL